MNLIRVYKCLCDLQRLRILNLLKEGPLCVCHLMELLNSDQVKVSKQLRYMKELGLLEVERDAQWRVYRLAEPTHPMLVENLKCLQDCAGDYPCFREDLIKRQEVIGNIQESNLNCPKVVLCEATSARGVKLSEIPVK